MNQTAIEGLNGLGPIITTQCSARPQEISEALEHIGVHVV
jgi:hypothetical protein